MAAISRYRLAPRIDLGSQQGTSSAIAYIRSMIKAGSMPIVNQMVTSGDDRLDTLAGTIYGDSRYWWILAAASNIGWGMQVPPGTVINIVRLSDVESAVT